MRHGFISIVGLLVLFFVSQFAHAEIDKVLVIVNNDVITQSEFDNRLFEAKQEMSRTGQKAPQEELSKQVMENMIMNQLQLTEARRRGINVSDEEVNLVIRGIVEKQGGTVSQLREFLSSQGVSYASYKRNIKESRIKAKLAQQFTSSRVVIADYEIDSFLATQGIKANEKEYLLAHILLKNTDGENIVDPEELKQKAQQVQQELQEGTSFKQAVDSYSDADDGEDGLLGWKKVDQLPKVFSEAVTTMEVGDISDVLESENGLHILQLVNKRSVGKQNTIMQSNVRHILVSAPDKVSQEQAIRKLEKVRDRILAGEDFSKLASAISDDSVSAAKGGELGWLSPGETVPNFEKTFQQLKLMELSEPVASRYGVHLIQVLERREHDISDQANRSRAEQVLRAEQSQVQFEQWVRRLRDQAYVEYVNYAQ